jgi:hypothetical protein
MTEFLRKYESGIFLSLLILFAAFMAVFLFVVVPENYAKEKKAKQIAEQMKCEYLGSAKHLDEVKFINCHGEIKMFLLK